MKLDARNPARAKRSANAASVSGRIGSAPHPAMRQLERSNASICDGFTRRKQSSYAKFGANDTVARNVEMASSHAVGRFRKRTGDRMVVSTREYTADNNIPINPMS